MMKRILTTSIFVSLTICLALVSCKKPAEPAGPGDDTGNQVQTDPEAPDASKIEDFKGMETIGLYDGALSAVFLFDEMSHEMVLNVKERSFIIQDDALLPLLSVKLVPMQEDDVFTAEIASPSKEEPVNTTVKIVRSAPDRLWLWSTDNSTGLIILNE